MTTENESYDFQSRIPAGFSRSRIISHLVREMDEFLASGPTATLPDSGSEVDTDINIRADTSIGSSSDEGAPDGNPGGPSDQGSVPAPSLGDGKDADEGSKPVATDAPVEAIRSDVEQAANERVQPTLEEGEGKPRIIEFSYPTSLRGGGAQQH